MTALPQQLGAAIRDAAWGRDLRSEVRSASETYRRGCGTRVTREVEALAYAVWRLPATFAATSAALDALAASQADARPLNLLDVGAGPGTAAWAAIERFPSIGTVTFVESAPWMSEIGRRFATDQPVLGAATWIGSLPDTACDLVVCSYAITEMGLAIIDRLWQLTTGALLVVEAGTPQGSATILEARDRLIDLGANIAAPCPAHIPCPMADGPAWCHFATRLQRDAQHIHAKGASLAYEDEPYSYVAAVRGDPSRATRLVGRPRYARGRVRLPLCTPDGLDEVTVPKSHAGYKAARKLSWGDGFDA